MTDNILEVRHLGTHFFTRSGTIKAADELSFRIKTGSTLALVGESGSGKSVTSLSILRLVPPPGRITAGEILFNGRDLMKLDDREMRRLRGREIAMIFQDPMTSLNPVYTVGDQIAEAIELHEHLPRRKAWTKTVEMMTLVKIPDAERRARDYPHQLSGGMRQRIMIAMAIVNRPRLLIADEPTTALDVTIQAQILALLAELRSKFGLAMLFISHDLAVVSQVADRVAVMYAGNLVELGSKLHIFQTAAHPYTQGLLQAVPTLKTERNHPLRTIEGTVPALQAMPPGCAFEPRCSEKVAECAHSLPKLAEISPGHWARCPVVNATSSLQ